MDLVTVYGAPGMAQETPTQHLFPPSASSGGSLQPPLTVCQPSIEAHSERCSHFITLTSCSEGPQLCPPRAPCKKTFPNLHQLVAVVLLQSFYLHCLDRVAEHKQGLDLHAVHQQQTELTGLTLVPEPCCCLQQHKGIWNVCKLQAVMLWCQHQAPTQKHVLHVPPHVHPKALRPQLQPAGR